MTLTCFLMLQRMEISGLMMVAGCNSSTFLCLVSTFTYSACSGQDVSLNASSLLCVLTISGRSSPRTRTFPHLINESNFGFGTFNNDPEGMNYSNISIMNTVIRLCVLSVFNGTNLCRVLINQLSLNKTNKSLQD